MQTADFRPHDDAAGRLDGACHRSILAQREVARSRALRFNRRTTETGLRVDCELAVVAELGFAALPHRLDQAEPRAPLVFVNRGQPDLAVDLPADECEPRAFVEAGKQADA